MDPAFFFPGRSPPPQKKIPDASAMTAPKASLLRNWLLCREGITTVSQILFWSRSQSKNPVSLDPKGVLPKLDLFLKFHLEEKAGSLFEMRGLLKRLSPRLLLHGDRLCGGSPKGSPWVLRPVPQQSAALFPLPGLALLQRNGLCRAGKCSHPLAWGALPAS